MREALLYRKNIASTYSLLDAGLITGYSSFEENIPVT